MGARAGQRPIENPEDDDEAKSEPAVNRKSEFFILNIFGFDIGCHTPSVHGEPSICPNS